MFYLLFWNNFKLTGMLQKLYKGPCTLHSDSSTVNFWTHLQSLSLSLTFYIYVSLYTHKKISKTNWEEILDTVLHYSFSTSVWSVEKTTFSYKAPVYWKILGNEQWCCYLIHSPYSKFTNYLATSMPSFCWGILRA